MSQSQAYLAIFDRSVAWGVYLGSAVLMLAILIWITHRWQRDTRLLLLALLAVLVLMPAPIPGHNALAPAFVFVVLGVITGAVEALAPILVRFSLAGILVVVLVAIQGVWWRQRRRKRVAERPSVRSSGATKKPARS
jgi:heme A synthase